MYWSPEKEILCNEYYLEKNVYLYNKRFYNWLIEDLQYELHNPGWEKI